MSEIAKAFIDRPALIGFLTAGDPSLTDSEEFIVAMATAGVDLIEIGVPFSDPIAEGPVIQAANLRALATGTTLDGVFDLVARVKRRTKTPLVLLTYLNPVLHYGYEAFFQRAAETGLDGVIIPDLPFEEQGELNYLADRNAVDLISMIAPTSMNRIAMIVAQAKGFIYLVSSMGVTGVRESIESDLTDLVAVVRAKSSLPVAIGFGIGTPKQAREASSLADGVIVGSAIVQIIAEHGAQSTEPLVEYVKSLKSAMLA